MIDCRSAAISEEYADFITNAVMKGVIRGYQDIME